MNYGSGCMGQAPPNKLRPFAQMSHEAQQGEQREGGAAVSSHPAPQISPQLSSIFPRYSILPPTDPERCFSIEPEDGTIRTAVPLDREARVWHNLTVLATELGEEAWAPSGPGECSSFPTEQLFPSMGWEGQSLPTYPHQCTAAGSPACIIPTRQASWSPGLGAVALP